ncbi:MAG: DUF1232 domain-containing protein [Bacteroidales bacterium]|nr:DUF1232 domain-containing protein [Bacteroidales bacterium]
MEKKQITSLVLAGLAVLYDISPVDVIPDIPVVGWVDDFFITATAGLNLIQQYTSESMQWLSTIAKTLKWLTIILGVIVVVLVAIFASMIVSFFTN